MRTHNLHNQKPIMTTHTKAITLDLTTNEEILKTAEYFNASHGWDVNAAIALAREVMEDANAHTEVRLFDAAPELLAALEYLLSRAQHLDQSPTHDGCENCDALARARVAIAKAKGNQ